MQAHLLVYDVPVDSGYPNPSPRLRRCAARVNLSCWVVPDGAIPHALLVEMSDAGVEWKLVAFSASEADKIAGIVIESLKKDFRDAVRSARDSMRRGEEQLREGRGEDRERNQKKFMAKAKLIRRRLATMANDLRTASRAFGLDPNAVVGVNAAQGVVNTLKNIAENRARAYVQGVQAMRRARTADGQAMAAAYERENLPASIMADYIMDNADYIPDAEATAQRLRDAFAEC